MADTLCRINITAGGFAVSLPVVIRSGSTDGILCKEWSISDDVMNLADTACVTVSNVDGENANVFRPGQKVELDLSNQDVAQGQWVRSFTGVITTVVYGSDASGGSVIQITAMDNGWFLTSCDAKPLVNIKGKTFKQLLAALIDPTWGIGSINATNDLNQKLKFGRQVIIQNLQPVLGAVLPYIQVEPGQKPADIIELYAKREGVLVNMGADGSLYFFRPDYSGQTLYSAFYRTGAANGFNNLIGRPSRSETIDGLCNEVQCWSTVVIDPAISGLSNPEDPNASFRHTVYKPPGGGPLNFNRRTVITDAEAINDTLRTNRCVWAYQMGIFNSFKYECEFDAHQQGGGFFIAGTMIDVDDQVNGVKGSYYVQSVQRSQTLGEGSKSKLLIRQAGLLNPALQSLYKAPGGLPKGKAPTPGGQLPPAVLAALGKTSVGGS